MRLEAHVDVANAKLRRALVRGATANKLDGGRTFLVADPLGRPRLWGLSVGAVVEGFNKGLASAPNAHGAELLHAAVASARAALAARSETLIERELPDVALVAMRLEGADLHVVSVGSCRAYLHRGQRTERVSSREEQEGGVLANTPIEARVSLEPSDLILAGSLSAFSSAAVSRVATVLERDPSTASSVVAQLLTEPAEQSGTGAAVVVARAR